MVAVNARLTAGFCAIRSRLASGGDHFGELRRTWMTSEICGFPGCERPLAPALDGASGLLRYCELPEHTALSAFRERRGSGGVSDPDAGEAGEPSGTERPVSLAAASLRALIGRLSADLERTRQVIVALSDTEQLEAELAAVRADARADGARAAQPEAAARRERIEADEAAETALRAAEQAEQRAQAAAGG